MVDFCNSFDSCIYLRMVVTFLVDVANVDFITMARNTKDDKGVFFVFHYFDILDDLVIV